jgi:hypothetical protein
MPSGRQDWEKETWQAIRSHKISEVFFIPGWVGKSSSDHKVMDYRSD